MFTIKFQRILRSVQTYLNILNFAIQYSQMDQIKSREAILLRKNEAINLELEDIKNSTSGIQEELHALDRRVRNILESHLFRSAEKNVQDESIFQN